MIHGSRWLRIVAFPMLLGALGSKAVLAADEDAGTDSGDAAAEQFTALDANHDGWVTAAEAAKDPSVPYADLLKGGDANGDGRLSRGEFESSVYERVANGPGKTDGEDQPEALFVQWDVDRNDRLSVDEVPADRRKDMDRMLAEVGRKDGSLSYEEFLVHFHPAPAKPAPTPTR